MSAYSATTKQDCYSMEERGASHEASQTRIEKDNKAPRLSLPVSGFSNVDVQHLPSSTHDGSQDKPLSSDSNFQIRIAQSHTTLEHNSVAWYQIFKVLRNVRASRKVSGKEFNILNGWGCVLAVFVHAAVFFTLGYISIENMSIFTPISNKRLGIACIVGSWFLLNVELLLTGGYLMTKIKHPLVRSRGIVYLTAISIGIFGTGLGGTFTALIRIGVIRTNMIVVSFIGALTITSTVFILGALASRQRLIFLLFEVKVSPSCNIYYHSYIWVVLWSLLVGSLIFTCSYVDYAKYRTASYIIVNVGCYVLFAILAYYSYRSRGIKLAFSDWRSNVVISLLCASMSTALTVLSALWLDPMTKYSAEWASTHITIAFVACYGMMFASCVCTVFLFGQIAIIVFYNIDPAQDLDPLTTFDFHLPPGGLDQYGPAGHPNINISNGGVLCAPSATPTNITPK